MIKNFYKLPAAALFLMGLLCVVPPAYGQKKLFILVRHAEKAEDTGNDPELTTAGSERARRLAKIIGKYRPGAVYSTAFRRTRSTAAPAASLRRLQVQTYDAVIYSIGIGDNFYDGVDKGALSRISERTGGRAFFPRDESELRQAFKQIEEEMRSQYLIAYEPQNQKLDGSYRTIEVQIVNPELSRQKIRLTHRQGYFAKNALKK